VSIEAMAWVLGTEVGDPVAKLVLIGLANHARADGTASWPSKKVLAEYAEVSTRTVVTKLQWLEERGFITLGDQRLTEYMRADRRPRVWDLLMSRGEDLSPREDDYLRGEAIISPRSTERGEAVISPREEPRGETPRTNGVKTVSPEPSLEPVRDSIDGQSLPRDSARGQRLDENWLPDKALIDEMRVERPDLDLKAEHAKFVDFWCSKPGKDGRKLDWRRTWRNWMRNAKQPANGHAAVKPVQQRILCAVCQKPQIACRRVARQTGDHHEWQPQEVRA
jgi:hypothetical protein